MKMLLLYMLFMVIFVSAQDITYCKVYDSLLNTVREGYRGSYHTSRNDIEKLTTNRVIRYYLLLFHDSITGDSDIPEIEDEDAFAFYGMKDAKFSLLNCMNQQLSENERTFIVEKIINMLYKIHETRPKIVLHILEIFSSLSQSPRIYHLRAESNYYLERWQNMYEDLIQCLNYNYTECLSLYWYINSITYQWDKIFQSSYQFLVDKQNNDNNNKDNELKRLYATIYYSRSLIALNQTKTGISNLLVLLNDHPNNELLWEVIDDIISSYGVIGFMNAVATLSNEISLTPCTKFKMNTYFPLTLVNDNDIQINGERIIQSLNNMVNQTEKIPNIENCPPAFFSRLSPLLLKDILIFDPLVKVLDYHPLRVQPQEEKIRVPNTPIKIAFILQTNVPYYSFPESLQNLIMRLPHNEFITTVYLTKKSDWFEDNYDEYIKTQCTDIELCKSYIRIEILQTEYVERIKQIYSQSYDVIVYENPFSDWQQYLLAFNRLAPIQIVSNECKSPTFLPTIDYIIAPAILNVNYNDLTSHFTEQVILYTASGYLYNIPNKVEVTLKREDIGFTDGHLLILYTGDYHTSVPGYDIFLRQILHVIPYAYIIMFKHGKILYYESFYRRLKKNIEPYFHRIHFVNLYSEEILMNYFSICDIYLETEFMPQPKNIILASNFKVPVIVIPQYGMKTTISAHMLQSMNETIGIKTNVYTSIEYIIDLVVKDNHLLKETKSSLDYSRHVLINDTIYLNEFISMLRIASGYQFNETKNITYNNIQYLLTQKRFDTLLYKTYQFITPVISDYEMWYYLATFYENVKEYNSAYQCIQFCLRLNSVYLPAILEKDAIMKRLNGTEIGAEMEILNFDDLNKVFNIDSL